MGTSVLKPQNMTTRFLFATGVLVAFSGLLAISVYYRVEIFGGYDVTSLLSIFLWQLVSWGPWVGVFAFLAFPFGRFVQRPILTWNIPTHLVAALTAALLHTLWFKYYSENFSPFLGLEGTRYGVFQWFFIFWFFLGLFLYWASISFFSLTRAEAALADKAKGTQRLVVKTGKVSEVVKPQDVFWIEAQDYYSVLHLPGKKSWIKMTMKELEGSLDETTFVRVHRSTIINVNFLQQLEKGASGKYTAVMKDGAKRPISRQGWRLLKPLLQASKN